jgi:hypothetical protein
VCGMGARVSKSESPAIQFEALPSEGVRKLWAETRRVCSLDQGVAAGFGLRRQDLATCIDASNSIPGWSIDSNEAFRSFDTDQVRRPQTVFWHQFLTMLQLQIGYVDALEFVCALAVLSSLSNEEKLLCKCT